MPKKETQCYGMTLGQLEAVAVSLAAQQGLTVEDADAALLQMTFHGFIKECSNHKGMYIMPRKLLRVAKTLSDQAET